MAGRRFHNLEPENTRPASCKELRFFTGHPYHIRKSKRDGRFDGQVRHSATLRQAIGRQAIGPGPIGHAESVDLIHG